MNYNNYKETLKHRQNSIALQLYNNCTIISETSTNM